MEWDRASWLAEGEGDTGSGSLENELLASLYRAGSTIFYLALPTVVSFRNRMTIPSRIVSVTVVDRTKSK